MSTGQGVLGCNMFCYCLNNPVNMTDESGCYAFRTNSVMMADGGGWDVCSDLSASLYNALLDKLKRTKDFADVDIYKRPGLKNFSVRTSEYDNTWRKAFSLAGSFAVDLLIGAFTGAVFKSKVVGTGIGVLKEGCSELADSNTMGFGTYQRYDIIQNIYVYPHPEYYACWNIYTGYGEKPHGLTTATVVTTYFIGDNGAVYYGGEYWSYPH